MQVRFAAHRAAMIAAFLILLPGQIGAGAADDPVVPRVRLAALVEKPEPSAPAIEHPETSVAGKWRAVQQRLRREQRLVLACRNDPAACPSDAATQFMAIVDTARLREGRARLGEINRAVNLAVRPVSDQKRHGGDVWTSPLATLASGEGDCEDYAIAKLVALWAAGVAESDTRFVIVHDPRSHEDHALTMVRLDGRWLALDNRRFSLVDAAHLTYRPLFVLAGDKIQAFADSASWAELDDEGTAGLSSPASPDTGSGPALL